MLYFHGRTSSTRTSFHHKTIISLAKCSNISKMLHVQTFTSASLILAMYNTHWTLKSQDIRKVKEVKLCLEKLAIHSTVPGWKDWATDLLQAELTLGTPAVLDLIDEAIKSILDGSQFKFFWFLHDISSGKKVFKFEGTMHCEASLASLLVHSKVGTIDGYEDILTQLKVG